VARALPAAHFKKRSGTTNKDESHESEGVKGRARRGLRPKLNTVEFFYHEIRENHEKRRGEPGKVAFSLRREVSRVANTRPIGRRSLNTTTLVCNSAFLSRSERATLIKPCGLAKRLPAAINLSRICGKKTASRLIGRTNFRFAISAR
jgi:hypothetical protein